MRILFRRFISSFGSLLIVVGLGLVLAVYGPIGWHWLEYRVGQVAPADQEEGFTQEERAELTPAFFEFGLLIPKIEVNARVFPHIDSTNKSEYIPVFKKGVAHAKGTSLPDEPGPVFIFAHSADNVFDIGQYNAVFFLLNALAEGDEVIVYFKGEKYSYLVDKKVITNPMGVSAAVAEESGDLLILQTCWPPGTTLKRLLVFAKLALL
ncbi:sortase [Patescibacteria group bacterium]|nr:sortase [Patescibacteria group bacterium]